MLHSVVERAFDNKRLTIILESSLGLACTSECSSSMGNSSALGEDAMGESSTLQGGVAIVVLWPVVQAYQKLNFVRICELGKGKLAV